MGFLVIYSHLFIPGITLHKPDHQKNSYKAKIAAIYPFITFNLSFYLDLFLINLTLQKKCHTDPTPCGDTGAKPLHL